VIFGLYKQPFRKILENRLRNSENYPDPALAYLSFPNTTELIEPDEVRTWGKRVVEGASKKFIDKCRLVEKGMKGQTWGQTYGDNLIYNTFFKNKTGPGVYIEIGAYHPTRISNSFFFDQCLAWHGICVEPDPTKQKTWVQETKNDGLRSCTLVSECLSMKEENVCLGRLNDGITHVANQLKAENSDCGPEQAKVRCTTLENMLETTLARSRNHSTVSLKASKKQTIDFVSLDVEGHELEVLRCFPFEKYDISVIMIEVNAAVVFTVRLDWFMFNKGYLKWDDYRNGLYPTDTLYVRRSLVHPVYNDPRIISNRYGKSRFNNKEGMLECPVESKTKA